MQPAEQRERLRETFTEAAELYDRMRPTYPTELFDALVAFGQLHAGSRVLEIGCGTGQATLSLAQRGFKLVAIELGTQMALFAKRKFVAFPNVEIINANFESWPLPDEPFDVVVAATAFHWLDPAVRVPKVAAALRPGGTLAIITTHHVAAGDVAFFTEVQPCYERWDPATPPGLRLESAEEIKTETYDIERSESLEPPTVRRFEWTAAYSSAEYRNLLLTYSGHRALESRLQTGLLECITSLIDSRYGGRITKGYMNELLLTHHRVERRR